MIELNTIIRLRNDETLDWASSTVILDKGEIGLEYQVDGKVRMKAGDGEHVFSELPYIGSQESQVYQNATVLPATNEEDDVTVIEGLIPEGVEVHNGDVGIVKRYITGNSGAISYTSYTYDDGVWAAMDGNYSAKNVFLKDSITLAGGFTSIGNYNKGDVIAAGTSLESLFSGMLQQEIVPGATGYGIDLPSASISASGSEGKVEVGNTFTLPTATLKIDDVGSYAYGDKATGITFAIGDVKLCEGADPATATNTKTNDAVMTKGSTLKLKASGDKVMYADTAKTYTFSATASYPAGKVPVTNLGNAYAAAQIPAGSVAIDDKSATFSGYRYAFAGGSTAATIDSAVVRSMTAKKNSKSSMDSESEALEFTASAGATKVFFAYPATWTGTPYFEMFGLAWATNSDIVAKDNIQVADARGTVDGVLQGAVAYKLYCWELDTPLQAETTKFRVWFK